MAMKWFNANLMDMMIGQNIGLIKNYLYKKGSGVGDFGINGNVVRDFYNENGSEKLEKQLKISFAKKDIENVFDKKVIKLIE